MNIDAPNTLKGHAMTRKHAKALARYCEKRATLFAHLDTIRADRWLKAARRWRDLAHA